MTRFEQISLDLFATIPQKNSLPSYDKEYIERYPKDLYKPDEDDNLQYVQYIQFKFWLYYNFPEFINKIEIAKKAIL